MSSLIAVIMLCFVNKDFLDVNDVSKQALTVQYYSKSFSRPFDIIKDTYCVKASNYGLDDTYLWGMLQKFRSERSSPTRRDILKTLNHLNRRFLILLKTYVKGEIDVNFILENLLKLLL
jgi:hypothetical protein